jgi:RNA polymerase sigma-70 factor (ECF subfamily)
MKSTRDFYELNDGHRRCSRALEFAVLLLLEKLSPTERAAYVLREAFDYSYDQIAHIVARPKRMLDNL